MKCSCSRAICLMVVVLMIQMVIGSNPTSTPVLANNFYTSVAVSSLKGSGSPSGIRYAGQFYYNANNATLAYELHDTAQGFANRLLVQSFASSTSFFQSSGPQSSCAAWSAANGSLQSLSSPSLFFWLTPTFLSDNHFSYLGVEYYRRGLTYYGTWHYQYSNKFVQVDYFHSIDFNIPFRLLVGWNPAIYYNNWNPIIVEFQTDYTQGFADLQPWKLAYVLTPATNNANGQPCSGQPAASSSAPALSAPPSPPPVASTWPLQWNGQTSFTGNDFGTLTTSLPQIQLVGHFYYDSPNSRECNYWEDVTSGERSKTVIVNGAFHAVTLSTGACVEPPVPIHESLHPNWTLNLPFNDNRWILRNTVHPDTGDFWLQAQHFAWDAFNAGPEHAFQYNQLPTGEPLLFQGPVYDFPPYLQSFSQWGAVEAGFGGIDIDNIFSTPDNCVVISSDAWQFIINPKLPSLFPHSSTHPIAPLPDEVAHIHSLIPLMQLRNAFFASLHSLRARLTQ